VDIDDPMPGDIARAAQQDEAFEEGVARRLPGWVRRVVAALFGYGFRPGDDRDERLRKALLAGFGWLAVVGELPDAIGAALAGARTHAAIALAYVALGIAGIGHFWRTGRRGLFQSCQFVACVVVGAIGHVYTGGFAAFSGTLLWASIPGFGALLLASRRAAYGWFSIYMVLVVALWFAEPQVAALEVPPLAHADRMVLAAGVCLGLVSMIFPLVYGFVAQLERTRARLAVEREKAERLLLNVLPAPIARRLREDGQTIADDFAEVTVVFADIAGFTPLSQRVGPARLVELLNRVFSEFDALAGELGVEKIKTIGDAYMAAAGLPEPRADHADAAARLALGMVDRLDRLRGEIGADVHMRIGMHTGPVVAGVIGRRKFIYDLWGDTVNTASRMESHGLPGRIHVSDATRACLGAAWRCEARGTIDVKGKGPMQTWFLVGPAG